MKIGKGGMVVPCGWLITKEGERLRRGQYVAANSEVVECHPETAKAIGFKAAKPEAGSKPK